MKSTQALFSAAVFLIFLITSLPLASAYSLTYDANGNLITGDGKYREYNGFNKLVRVRDGNNATGNLLEEYMWEADKDKVLVKHVYENNTWKESVYYPSQTFLMVKNASGTFKYKYIYQNGQLVAFENYNGKKFFILGDHKGSASVIINESGAKVEETFYEPFGKVISGGVVSRFSYEGKELSSVLQDYDFHARKYDPNLKVFTQPDTLLQNVYNPQSLNRYSFETNNPIKQIDEQGKYGVITHFNRGYEGSRSGGVGRIESFRHGLNNMWTDISGETSANSYHFGSRGNIEINLMNAIQEADATNFEHYLHALMDTFAHEGYDASTHGTGPMEATFWATFKQRQGEGSGFIDSLQEALVKGYKAGNLQIDKFDSNSVRDRAMMAYTSYYYGLWTARTQSEQRGGSGALFSMGGDTFISTSGGYTYSVPSSWVARYPNAPWTKKEQGKGLCLTCK